jgi:hypothetical protein
MIVFVTDFFQGIYPPELIRSGEVIDPFSTEQEFNTTIFRTLHSLRGNYDAEIGLTKFHYSQNVMNYVAGYIVECNWNSEIVRR